MLTRKPDPDNAGGGIGYGSLCYYINLCLLYFY